MPDPVTIRYQLHDGTDVEVRLHQVGHAGEWVLDLHMSRDASVGPTHQHAIDGEPEVTVG